MKEAPIGEPLSLFDSPMKPFFYGFFTVFSIYSLNLAALVRVPADRAKGMFPKGNTAGFMIRVLGCVRVKHMAAVRAFGPHDPFYGDQV